MWARNISLIAVAIGLTSCACWPAATGATPPPDKTVATVVATRDIPPGSQITADMVTVQNFSQDQAPPWTFHDPKLVIGKYAILSIHAAQAISDNLISLQPIEIGAQSPTKNIWIVVAGQDIPACGQLGSDMLLLQNFSADQAPPFAFHSPDLVAGKYAVISIHRGQAISDNMVLNRQPTCPAR